MKHKMTVGLFNVHEGCKVSFMLFLDYLDDEMNRISPMVTKSTYNGYKTIKIQPRGFISVDITSYEAKKEGYDSGNFFTLGSIELFYFIKVLEKMIEYFKNPKLDLFYTTDAGKLIVDPDLANEISLAVRVKGNKVVKFIPTTVEHENRLYEGCCMCINSLNNITYMTINEMEYFLYELKKIDIPMLTLSTIITYQMLKDEEFNKLQLPKFTTPQLPIKEQKQEEKEPKNEATSLHVKMEGEAIPDI